MPGPTPPQFQLKYQSNLDAPATVFQFDGSASITQTAMNNFPIQALTISFWVKTSQSGTNVNQAVLFTYDQRDTNQKRLYIKNPANLEVGFGSASTGPTGVIINDGHWHQIAVSLSPADSTHYRVQVYYDGFLAYQSLGAISFSAGNGLEESGNLVLGRGDSVANEIGFVGAMCEFSLWSQVCSEDQIWAQLERRLSGNETNLILSWHLDSAQSAGTISGGSFIDSDLCFRTSQLTATIINFQPSGTYQIQYCQVTGRRFCKTDTFTSNTYTIVSPNMNQTYEIKLQVTVTGETSDWSGAQQVVILNLGAVLLQPFQYSSANQSLTASWEAVDQAQQYQVALFQDGAPSGSPTLQTATTYLLPTQLTDMHTWTIQVNAVSGAAFGPVNMPATLAPLNLTFDYSSETSTTGLLEASWQALTNATNYYLEVFKQSGNTWNQVFTTWTSAIDVQISNTQVPTQQGDIFKARVRSLSPDAIGAWSAEQQLTVTNLPRPTLTYNWDTNTNALIVGWDEIAVGVTYRLQIFQDTDPTPIVNQSGLTTRTYTLTPYLQQPHAYTIKVSGQQNGSIGPTNQVVVPPPLQPVYLYSTTTTSLMVRWTAAPDVYLAVTPPASGAVSQHFFDETTSSYTVPAPTGGFLEGSQYTFLIRSLAQGTIAASENSSVVIHNLAQPDVSYVYSTAPEKLLATWNDIRTQAQKDSGLAVTYRVQVVVGDTPQTPVEQTTLNFDLTAYLSMAQTAPVTVQVTGIAQGSVGIASQILAYSDIHQQLTYDEAHTTLAATWQANNPVYLRVYKQGAESAAVTHYAQAGENAYQVPTPPGGFQVNDIWICQAKSLPQGSIGPLVTAQATILALAAPVLSFTYNQSERKLVVSWPDSLTSAQAGLMLTYNAALYQANNLTPIDSVSALPNTAAGRVYTLPDKLDIDAPFTVKVQGSAEGTLGLANTVPSLTTTNMAALTYQAAAGTVSASWTASTGAQDLLYYLELLDTSNSSIVHSEMTSNLSTTFPLTATSGRTYQAQIRALADGFITAYAGTKNSVITYPGMVAPTVNAPTIDASAGTVAATWDFAETAYPAGSVSYSVQLSGDATGNQVVSTKSVTFSNITVAAGKSYTISVQAISGGTYGRAGTNTSVADAPPKVQNVNASTNESSAIIVSWNNLVGDGYSYHIRVTGPNSFTYTYPTSVSTGPVTLSQSDTHVSQGVTYQVTVAASKNGLTGPWSDPASVTAGQTPYVPPNNQPNDNPGGDPVNLATGSFSLSNPELVFGGIFPLQFITYYNVYTPIQSENALFDGKPLGNRWNHVYNTRIVQDTQNQKVYLLWGDGRTDIFKIPSSITGSYAVDGVYNGTTLSLSADLIYTVTRADQTRYLFDQNGKLTQMLSPIGNAISLTYKNGLLDRVTDNQNNRWFQFSYNGDGRISGITDSANRSIIYQYYPDGDLKSYTDPLNGVRTYTYWDSAGLANTSLLKTIVDQNGTTSLYNEYAAYTDRGATKYRITLQQDAKAYAASQQSQPQHYGLSIAYSQSGSGDQAILTATVLDNMGNQTIYQSLAVNGNVLSAVTGLPSGNIYQRTWTYDGFNNPLSETTYEGPASGFGTNGGNTKTFTYDGNLNLLSVSYPAPIGQIVGYTYYDNNLLKTQTDRSGNTTSYQYYADNTLKQVTDPLNRTNSYTYYSGAIHGLIQTRRDELGNTFTYTYQLDELDTITDPLKNSVRYHWNNLGLNTSIDYVDATTGLLQTRSFTYSAMGFQLSSAIQVAGQPANNAYTTRNTPTPMNQIHTTTDPVGNTTTFTYDLNLSLETITYPPASALQSVTTNAYDRNGNLTSIQQAPNIIEHYTYDPLNRRKTYRDPNGNTYTYVYSWVFQGNHASYPSSIAIQYPQLDGDPTVYQTTEVYDVSGRLIARTNRAGETTTFTYTTYHDGITQTNQSVVTTTFPPATPGDSLTQYHTTEVFDVLGRLVSYTDEANRTTTITYTSKAGGPNNTNVLEVTESDPLNNQKISTFDAMNRLIALVEGKTGQTRTTQSTYDALDRLTKVVNVRGSGNLETDYLYTYDGSNNTIQTEVRGSGSASTILTFNGANQLLKETDALGKSALRTYHPRGLLHTYQQANGKTLTYDYDNAGRYTRLTHSDQSEIVQILDANGNRLNTQLDGQISTTRHFDNWNRITSYTNNHQNTIGYTHTPEDLLHILTYPGDTTKKVTYAYDGLQRLSTVTDWSNRVTGYSYDPTGMLNTITYPNQCTTRFQFDTASRLTGLVNSVQGRVAYASNYTLDALGMPTSATFILPLAPIYSAQSHMATYNNANEMDTRNTAHISYDDAGNTTALPGVSPIVYNDENLITAFGTDTYSYNVEGLRDQAVVGNQATRFVISPNQYSAPYQEQASESRAIKAADIYQSETGSMGYSPIDAASNLVQPFSSSLDQILQTVDSAGNVQHRYIYGIGLLAEEDAGGNYRAYLFDERGSTIALTDPSGAIVASFAYGPYGVLLAHTGELPLFLYDGRDGVVSDANGLTYMRSRYFSPVQLRFLQRDFLFGDIRYPQSLNRYAYATGDPICMIDPLGLSSTAWKIFGGVVGGIVIGGITGLVVGGLAGGSAAAGGAAGAVGGGIIGGVIGGLVGGPIGGAIGGTIGTVGGGALGGSGSAVGSRLVTLGSRFGSRLLVRFGNFIRGPYNSMPPYTYSPLSTVEEGIELTVMH